MAVAGKCAVGHIRKAVQICGAQNAAWLENGG